MPARHINTKNGALAMPTGIFGVFQSFEVEESYAADDATCYGTAVYGVMITNGTPIQRVTVNGFTQNGAASSSPGFGAMTDADGATTTLTYDTGTTLAGNYITTSIRTSHSRSRAACPTSWQLASAGDVTATWATT